MSNLWTSFASWLAKCWASRCQCLPRSCASGFCEVGFCDWCTKERPLRRARCPQHGKFLVVLAAVCVLLLQVSPQAVGTLTITVTSLSDVRVIKYTLAWVSDASGDVSGNASALSTGAVIQIKYIPDGGGTAPTALYDVTLIDTDGVDLLGGGGANLSATVSTMVRPAAPLFYDGTQALDLVVANAGISKGGTVQVWIQQQL